MENSTDTLNAEANAWAVLCSNGTIKFYDGVKPTDPQVAITTQVLLASVPFGVSPFDAAVDGVISLSEYLTGVITTAGTTTWARLWKSDGLTVICDASVGVYTSGEDIEIEDVVLTLDDLVEVQTLNYTRPAA